VNVWRLLCRMGACNRSCRGRGDHRSIDYWPWSARPALDDIDWHDRLLRKDREWSRASWVALIAALGWALLTLDVDASRQAAAGLAGWAMIGLMCLSFWRESVWRRRHARWHAQR
jgi:hypothetical protein